MSQSRVKHRKTSDAIELPKETGVVFCSNPKCHRKIEEPILLNNLSITPTEQYHACPYCFTKLNEYAEENENIAEEPAASPPVHPSLEKVLDVISAQPQREKEEKTIEEEPAAKTSEEEEKGLSGCPHSFGYLANRPRDAPIPAECLTCQKIVDCMLKLRSA